MFRPQERPVHVSRCLVGAAVGAQSVRRGHDGGERADVVACLALGVVAGMARVLARKSLALGIVATSALLSLHMYVCVRARVCLCVCVMCV